MNNLFEELRTRKEKLVQLVEKATEYNWIDNIRKGEILDKLSKDTLTIGVIGQMKCGKSTFLNAFVFENDILPAATTPMTAALSVITYGEKERIVAEFYTKDEWEEQKMQAARPINDPNNPVSSEEELKIKAAKELVSKANKLGSKLDSYLGKTQEDEFKNLEEYVGADGKYISITKAVNIYYPKEYLKGVEIVDTPGFNDPIVSREERTKAFLKKADVVLMMIYAGRPFDATDRDILMKHVRQSGIGKVLVGINKYDLPYIDENNPLDEDDQREYVKEGIRKACKECNDDSLVEILKQTEPIPLSAQMALLSYLPMSEISSSDEYSTAWKRLCNGFGISSQKEMFEKSHMNDLTSAVKQVIENEKAIILFKKPVNAIKAAGNDLIQKEETDLRLLDSRLEALNMPDDELDEQERSLEKAYRRLNKKIDSLGDSVDSSLRDIVRKGTRDLEDQVSVACNRMTSIVDTDFGLFTNSKNIVVKLNIEIDKLTTRTLKRTCGDIRDEAEKVIKRCLSDFIDESEEVLRKYLPQVDSREFTKVIKNKVILEITSEDLFIVNDNDEETDFMDVIASFFNGATFGILGKSIDILSHGDTKRKLLIDINNISSKFNPKTYLESVFTNKDKLVGEMQEEFIEKLIKPLLDQVKEIKENKANKEKEIEDTTTKVENLHKHISSLTEQMAEMERLERGIV